MLHVLKPGLQSTLQGAPRRGLRHLGFPDAGPADSLSMALANRLVGNALDATCLEITYGDFEAVAETDCVLAITGAAESIEISGQNISAHRTIRLRAGNSLFIAPIKTGARAYLAIRSGFQARPDFGSTSTYLPAQLGGYSGRALIQGDLLHPNEHSSFAQDLETPERLRPIFANSFALRACESAETGLLDPAPLETLFTATFTAGRQNTRMGISLTGHEIIPNSDGDMKSAPVFPGTIQGPPSGTPIALLCDAQTTGGYPRIASIARCDQHLLGQVRPGDRVRLLKRSPDKAAQEFVEKQALFAAWLQS